MKKRAERGAGIACYNSTNAKASNVMFVGESSSSSYLLNNDLYEENCPSSLFINPNIPCDPSSSCSDCPVLFFSPFYFYLIIIYY